MKFSWLATDIIPMALRLPLGFVTKASYLMIFPKKTNQFKILIEFYKSKNFYPQSFECSWREIHSLESETSYYSIQSEKVESNVHYLSFLNSREKNLPKKN